jgi:hypothetical protein
MHDEQWFFGFVILCDMILYMLVKNFPWVASGV